MRRLIFVTGVICLSFALLLFLDDDARSEAAACGDPLPTATPGPPTVAPVTPMASPSVYSTVDLNSLPVADAPAGLHTIAACESRDQVRAMLDPLMGLLDDWELVPIGKGPPPEVILVVFEDPADSQRTIALVTSGDGPTKNDGGMAQSIACGHQESPEPGASIATDGRLVWMRHERDGLSHLTWGATDGARRYSISASNPADLKTMLDALARAAERACGANCP